MMNRIESFRSIGSRILTVCKFIGRQRFSRTLFLLFCCKLAFSQFNSGFTGVVTDQTSAAIPDAKIIVTNEATGVTRTVLSASSGDSVFHHYLVVRTRSK